MTLPNQAHLRARTRTPGVAGPNGARARRNADQDLVNQDLEEPLYLTPQGKIGWRKEGILFLLRDMIEEPLYVTDQGKLAIRLGAQMTLDTDGALTLDLDLTSDG